MVMIVSGKTCEIWPFYDWLIDCGASVTLSRRDRNVILKGELTESEKQSASPAIVVQFCFLDQRGSERDFFHKPYFPKEHSGFVKKILIGPALNVLWEQNKSCEKMLSIQTSIQNT